MTEDQGKGMRSSCISSKQGLIALPSLTDLEFYLPFVMYISFSGLIDVHFNLVSPIKVLVVFCQVGSFPLLHPGEVSLSAVLAGSRVACWFPLSLNGRIAMQ